MKEKCIICGREGSSSLCGKCVPQKLSGPVCQVCGMPVSSFVSRCSCCREEDGFQNRSLFHYSGDMKEILHQYKFRRLRRLSLFFARELYIYLQENYEDPVVVPVPSSWLKRKRKGWCQIEDVVRHLKRWNVDVCCCLKKRPVKVQKRLSREEREDNVCGAFTLKKRKRVFPEGRPVVVLDDVYTTGSTVKACCDALRSAVSADITSLTIAHD